MKYLIAIFALLMGISCASKKPLMYNYPSKIKKKEKAAFVKDCEMGKVLYGIHCAPCHNRIVNGVEVIPNFTPVQLEGYDLRMDEPKHKGNLTERKVPQEELDLIIKYLWYKKPAKTTS